MCLENHLAGNQWYSSKYPIDTKEIRIKSGILAISTPMVHTALAVANIAFRCLRLISFYHFWKEAESEEKNYFQIRLLAAGKDALRMITQPIGWVALEITALIGIFFPLKGINAYCALENVLYGRPLTAQLLDLPIDQILLNTDIAFQSSKWYMAANSNREDERQQESLPLPRNSTSKQEKQLEAARPRGAPAPFNKNPAPLSLKNEIEEIVREENTNRIPNTIRFADSCMKVLAKHFISIDLKVVNMNRYQDLRQIVLEATKRLFNPKLLDDKKIFIYVARELFENSLKNESYDQLKKFLKFEPLQKPVNEVICERIKGLNTKNLEDFEKDYTPLIKLIKSFQEDTDPLNSFRLNVEIFDYLTKHQEALVKRYIQTFKNIQKAVMREEKKESLKTDISILKIMIQTIENDEDVIKELLKVPYESKHISGLEYYFMADPAIKKVLIGLRLANKIENLDFFDLTQFSVEIDPILERVPEKDEKNFYLEYFLIKIKSIIEDVAVKVKTSLNEKVFNLNLKSEMMLNTKIKNTILKINNILDLNIELEIHMDTENDELIASLLSD